MSARVAAGVSGLDLADYQRAVRLVLRHPLVTASYPDPGALPRIRRWYPQLRTDLAELCGYRLELSGDTARLVRVADALVPDQPALTGTERPFDRRRYAYLALALAALGRAGIQVALSELADAVAADAGRIPGLSLATDVHLHRVAFVDAVTWLERRGAVRLADGTAAAWASDPERAEALYDIDRDVVNAIFRPTRVLPHVGSVSALLGSVPVGVAGPGGPSRDVARRSAAQRARRAVLEFPVVYYVDVAADLVGHLRGPALTEDLERLTGLRVERRAEGILLVDTAGWTEPRFPGTGAVAQTALLLAAEIADRVIDVDAPPLARLPAPRAAERSAWLVAEVDTGKPVTALPDGLTEAPELGPDEAAVAGTEEAESARYPLLPEAWLTATVERIVNRYAPGFGERWRADPGRLAHDALALLATHRLVQPVPGGVLALPLLGRYRVVTATVRRRPPVAADPALFQLRERPAG